MEQAPAEDVVISESATGITVSPNVIVAQAPEAPEEVLFENLSVLETAAPNN